MNNDIESKLNELLKMKDDLDTLKSERKQHEAIEDFEKKQKTLKIWFYVWLGICIAILLGGMYGLDNNTGKYQLHGLFMALVGLNSSILIKLWYFIKETKLSILQEMKQLQIQIAKTDIKTDAK